MRAQATVLRALRSAPTHLVVVTLGVLWLLPSLGLLVSSFRPADRVATTGWWRVSASELTLENYAEVLGRGGLAESFVNSLLLSLPATVGVVAIGAMTAYALARMTFRGRDWLLTFILVFGVVPVQMTLGPTLGLMNQLGLSGTFPAIWLVHTGYGLPFAIYLLTGFFAALPKEMFEAAEMDGASAGVSFMRLALPTALPALASLAIFQFMWVWNDLLVALIFLGGRASVAPITVTISNLVGQYGQGWQTLTAAAFVSMLLPLLVFFGLQRYFVEGILAGSVKG